MKRIILSIFFFTIILHLVPLQENNYSLVEFIDDGQYLILKLPYGVDANCQFVFEEDTPIAIDIIEIIADEDKLTYIDDTNVPVSRTYLNINSIIPGQKKYYISMYWIRNSPESLRWNDGRGIIFTEIEPGLFQHNTNSYELLSRMQFIEIKYRIRIPFQFKLFSPFAFNIFKFIDNDYSEIYTIRVNLSEIWESLK